MWYTYGDQELDHLRKLSCKLITGKLYVSDSAEGLTIPDKLLLRGQNERAALTVLIISRQPGHTSAFHDGNRMRITLRLPAGWENTST